MLKKIGAFLLGLLLVVSLVACGPADGGPGAEDDTPQIQEQAPENEAD